MGLKGSAKAFEKIMQVLVAHNYTQTIKQRQDKIKSLHHYKDVIDRNMNSGAGNKSDDEISLKDFREGQGSPIHTVIDGTNTQQIDVSRHESEENELLNFMPHENPSIEETTGGDEF